MKRSKKPIPPIVSVGEETEETQLFDLPDDVLEEIASHLQKEQDKAAFAKVAKKFSVVEKGARLRDIHQLSPQALEIKNYLDGVLEEGKAIPLEKASEMTDFFQGCLEDLSMGGSRESVVFYHNKGDVKKMMSNELDTSAVNIIDPSINFFIKNEQYRDLLLGTQIPRYLYAFLKASEKQNFVGAVKLLLDHPNFTDALADREYGLNLRLIVAAKVGYTSYIKNQIELIKQNSAQQTDPSSEQNPRYINLDRLILFAAKARRTTAVKELYKMRLEAKKIIKTNPNIYYQIFGGRPHQPRHVMDDSLREYGFDLSTLPGHNFVQQKLEGVRRFTKKL